jgi:hypothetical protein
MPLSTRPGAHLLKPGADPWAGLPCYPIETPSAPAASMARAG